jgi:hypothetical protein
MLDILDPSEDDAKLHVTLIINGHADAVAREVSRMPSPVLRDYTMIVLNLLATVKSEELANHSE